MVSSSCVVYLNFWATQLHLKPVNYHLRTKYIILFARTFEISTYIALIVSKIKKTAHSSKKKMLCSSLSATMLFYCIAPHLWFCIDTDILFFVSFIYSPSLSLSIKMFWNAIIYRSIKWGKLFRKLVRICSFVYSKI